MDFLQSVGQSYLERKAYGAPQQLENHVKKQFVKPRGGSAEKATQGHVDAKASKSNSGSKHESVAIHPPKTHHTGSRDIDQELANLRKEKEIADLKRQLRGFNSVRESDDVDKHAPSTYSEHGGLSKRNSMVSKHTPPAAAEPSESGVFGAKSARRSSHMTTERSLQSHATAPAIVVVSDAGGRNASHPVAHARSNAPSHRSSRSKSHTNDSRTARGRSRGRTGSPEALPVSSSHRASSEAGIKHKPFVVSLAHSGHRANSPRGPNETRSRLTQENLSALSVPHTAQPIYSHAPSQARSHHTVPSKAAGKHTGIIKVSEAGHPDREIIVDTASHAPSYARSHHTSHSTRPANLGGAIKASELGLPAGGSHTPSEAVSHHTARQSYIREAPRSAYRSGSPGAESVAGWIYPESSISQRSERSHVPHSGSHYGHQKSHSAYHAPSHAPSHHQPHAPTPAPSHHTTHSHHASSGASEADTIKGSPYNDHSHDGPSHASSHILKSHPSKAADSDSDDSPSEHGGSAALIHQRSRYRRSASGGRVPHLTPVEERPECCGNGFRPCREHSPKMEKTVVEVSEVVEDRGSRGDEAPHVREVERQKDFETERGWWKPGREAVLIGREDGGKKIYRVK